MPKIFRYMAETYGPISSLYLGPRPTVIVSNAKILKEIYKLDHVTLNILTNYTNYLLINNLKMFLFFWFKIES